MAPFIKETNIETESWVLGVLFAFHVLHLTLAMGALDLASGGHCSWLDAWVIA
jgi:hypothetical protein